jgi:hypothetical protein
MKSLLLTLCVLLAAAESEAADWTRAASDMLQGSDSDNREATSQAVDYAAGLLPALTNSLGVSDKQATGGTGALLNLVKDNLDAESFSALTGMLPGLDVASLLKAAPELGGNSSLTSMLGSSGEALAGAQEVFSQFKALGLSTEQLGEYIRITNGYLQSEGGQSAVALFQKGLGSLATML